MMRNLVKTLAVLALVVIVGSFANSIYKVRAADSTCPVLGNNLIDNIDPNVLVNLRLGYKNAGGSDNCWLHETFLFRIPDFQNTAKMQLFFQIAAANHIQPVIRVASDNSGDSWQAITPDQAKGIAASLNSAIGSQFSSDHPVSAYFGNEVNLNNEWGSHADPTSYADALFSFASTATNFKVLFPPLSYCGDTTNPDGACAGRGIGPLTFLRGVKTELDKLTNGHSTDWINAHIAGYAFVVLGSNPSQIASDFQNEINTLGLAGFPIFGKTFVISELGLPGGIPGDPQTFWNLFQAALSVANKYTSQFIATIYARDPDGKVHSYYYITDPSGNLTSSGQYNKLVINLGGSTSHGASQPTSDAILGATFLPLGSLQPCPPEIPTNGIIPNNTSPNQSVRGQTCGYTPLPEPAGCTNPPPVGSSQYEEFWTGDAALARFCHPDHCAAVNQFYGKSDSDCAVWMKPPHDEVLQNVIKIYTGQLSCAAAAGSPQSDPRVPYSLGYVIWMDQNGLLSSSTPGTNNGSIQTLPACVPTYNPKANCVSECSQPIKFNENLTVSGANCLRSGNCLAQIGLKDQNGNPSFGLPFVKDLADYFSGIIDAEHMSPSDLDKYRAALSGTSTTTSIDDAFHYAGVAKKLLPSDLQDQLKCNFIDYVKNRLQNKLNTKYTNFMIYDQKITDIPCKKTFVGDFTSWEKYWFAIPLFQNDDAQGTIEFASPTLWDNKPIYVSLPEVARLASATAMLQAALVPQANITAPRQLQTYGQTIKPIISDSACTPSQKWSDLYNATDYNRAVTCDVPALLGTADSTVCVVGPYGELQCARQDKAGGTLQPGINNLTETVQVRTVFPFLFDIAEQTIQKSTGLLRIFKPEVETAAFDPIPAAIGNVHYYLPVSNGLAIDDTGHKETGWQIFFYRLGGLWNARNFVLQLLWPQK